MKRTSAFVALGIMTILALTIVTAGRFTISSEDRRDASSVATQGPMQRFPSIVVESDEESASSTPAETSSAQSYVQIVSGSEIASRIGYEVVIALLAMGSPQNPDGVSRRMNVDTSRAGELISEFQAFIEERTENQWGYLRDTCNQRDSIHTVDHLVKEHQERLRRNDQDVAQQIALLLSRLTPEEAEQLMHLAEEARATATAAEVDPEDYYRARGTIDVQEELTRLCSRLLR